MREHEVPTHVQAEDRVLLGFTFPQVVAVVAVCAISYGAYRYAPVGPSEVRMALAVVLGLFGVAMVVGQDRGSAAAPGGRRPAQVPAGGQALRRAGVPAGEDRGARAGTAGQERPGPPAADGAQVEARPSQPAQEEEQAEGPPQRADALPSPRLVRQAPQERRTPAESRPQRRDPGDQTPEAPQGVDRGRGPRPGGGGRDAPPDGAGRRPRALAG